MSLQGKTLLFSLLLAVPAVAHAHARAARITGEYLESRNADVYTGPCFANSEVNLTGQEAVLAWHVERGAFDGVPLDGLSVVAVVRASSTLGDPYSNPLPARAAFVVDSNASPAQRSALVHFAQSQTGALLSHVVGISAVPISFRMGPAHGAASLQAGNLVRLVTRGVTSGDLICHNEEVFYPPLAAHLTHAMPAVSTDSTYRGGRLGITWSESGRRGSFVGSFAD
jgi:hypothetical protein